MMKTETLSYGAWSSGIHGRARGRRLPINATLEVTHRCPLACAHCYNNLPVGDRDARARELSTDELRSVIDGLADAGALWLLFTGGEIFARADFLELYKHAKGRGFLITLFTNATQITESIADTLVEWPPFAVEITLYGRTRETYERVTGVPGSYDRCIRGIRLLKERGVPLSLKTVALSLNHHEIGDMQRFAEDELGVGFKFDGMINARIDCSQSPLSVRLAPAELVALDLDDPRRAGEWAKLVGPAAGPAATTASTTLYNCGGGTSAVAVDPEGKMRICVLSQRDGVDVRAGSVEAAWQELAEVRARPVTRATKCTTCRLRQICSTCAATSDLEHGDAEAPVDYFCEVAHLRALAVGVEPPRHGDCAFCEGGSEHPRLLRALETVRAARPARGRSLPVVREDAETSGRGTSCGSGCDACGSAR
ncbi:MAG TPA: radical SAM protein [Polyangia bacterium]|jgi:radical SAM protein with 4Fe4S-binding SPASM domain|nr:radical SAM protein [Polyangia bacterium]